MRSSRLPIFLFLTLLLVSLLCTSVRGSTEFVERTQSAPPNDSIAHATVVSTLPFADDIAVADASLATDEILLTCEGGVHSFWYSFTPTNTGLYRIASGVDGATEVLPANDLTLALFTINDDGSVNDPLECEQDDRTDGGGEVFFADLEASTTYYVRVALVEATTGDELITTSIEYVEEITFTGAQNPFWENPDNWSPAQVPTANDKVIIPEAADNTCFIRSVGGVAFAAEARMIEIDNNNLTLGSDNSLTLAEGEDGIRITGEDGSLIVNGQLNIRDMTNDGINLTDGNVSFEDDDSVLIENIGDDGLQGLNGTYTIKKDFTIRNVGDNGISLDGGTVFLRADHSVIIEDITDHGITVFNSGELFAQGELTIQRVGKDGITTPGGWLEISSTGVVNIETAGDFGIGDADFVNDGYLRIDDAVEDGIDTDFECTNNGEIYISNTGDDGIDIQDDSTFVNNGYLEVDNASDDAIVSGYFINTEEGELVFNGSLSSETIYANGSRLSVGPDVDSGSLSVDPVLDSVTLVVEIEGTFFSGGNDDLFTIGDFDLADSKLELVGDYVPEIDETFTIVSASDGSILGNFEGLTEGSTLTFNGVEMSISYMGGDTNSQRVVLTAISLPTYTWTGAEDTNWGNANNWNTGAVPGTADSVYIPVTANNPVVNTGFATVGSILLDGAELTVASGTILNVRDQATGLTITNDGQVNVNGPLNISDQQSKGIDIVSGFIVISESTRLTVDNSFVELDFGLIDINGELFINNAVEDGLRSIGEGAILVPETGTLQIDEAAGDGLVFLVEAGLVQEGTTTITDCGGEGISIPAGRTLTVRETGDLTISDTGGQGLYLGSGATFSVEANGSAQILRTAANIIFMEDETSTVVNAGLLSLVDPGFSCIFRGHLTNLSGATLQAAGFVTSDATFEAGSILEVNDGTDIFFFSEIDLAGVEILIDLEGPDDADHDAVDLGGGGNIAGAELVFAGDYQPALGDQFRILDAGISTSVTGRFEGLNNGATFLFNGAILEIEYVTTPSLFYINLNVVEVLDPLPNDDLSNATPLSFTQTSDTVFTVNNDGIATIETNEVDCRETVSWWYSYTPEATAAYILTTKSLAEPAELTETNDVTLAVFTGSTHPLTEIICQDINNVAGGGEITILTLEAGVAYRIRVGAPADVLMDEIETSVVDNTSTWSGAVSSDWFDSGNWENGVVPFPEAAVTIPEGVPNQPVIGSGEVTIADLTVEEGNTFTLAEGAGLTVDGGETGISLSGDSITVAGELVVDNVGDENFGIDLFRGTLYVTPTGSVRLDSLGINDFLAANLVVAGSLEVSNTLNVGIGLANDASTFTVEAGGSVVINNSTNTGLQIGGPVQIDGSLTITGCGGDGIDLSAGAGITVGANGSLSVTDCTENGIRLGNDTTEVVNNGFLTLLGNGEAALLGGLLTNEIGATLQAAGLIVADFASKSSSTLEVGDGIDGLLFFGTTSFDGASIILDLEGTDLQAGEHDVLNFPGGGDLSGAELVLRGSYVPSVGDVFTIHNTGLFALINGTYNGLPDGGTLLFNGALLEIDYAVAGVPTFQIDLRATAVLPLDLLSFTGEARAKTNLLTWTTANEEDFSHFEVERSADGRGSWSVLTQSDLQASGVTPTSPLSPGEGPGVRSYAYTDQSPRPQAYYRLKMIDLDGTFVYSEAILLENSSGAGAGAMRVYPNPSNGRFAVDLSGVSRSAAQSGKLGLVDMHGRTVWSADAGSNQVLTVELPRPAPGIYLLSFATTDGTALVQRIIIH